MSDAPTHPRRRWVTLGAVVLVPLLLVGWCATSILWPSVGEPGESDALVVLGASWPIRTDLAERLMREGRAKALVVSAHPADTTSTPAPCVGKGARPYPVYCFDPDPSTTRGEAQAVARLAREHGWRSIQVITFRPQMSRAGVLLGRCYDGKVSMIDSGEDYSPFDQIIYQGGAWVKVALQPSC